MKSKRNRGRARNCGTAENTTRAVVAEYGKRPRRERHKVLLTAVRKNGVKQTLADLDRMAKAANSKDAGFITRDRAWLEKHHGGAAQAPLRRAESRANGRGALSDADRELLRKLARGALAWSKASFGFEAFIRLQRLGLVTETGGGDYVTITQRGLRALIGRRRARKNYSPGATANSGSRKSRQSHAPSATLAAVGLTGGVPAPRTPIPWLQAQAQNPLAAFSPEIPVRANHHLTVGQRVRYTPLVGVFGTVTETHPGDTYDVRWETTGQLQAGIQGSRLVAA